MMIGSRCPNSEGKRPRCILDSSGRRTEQCRKQAILRRRVALVTAGIKPWDFPKLRPDWVPPPPGTVETIDGEGWAS